MLLDANGIMMMQMESESRSVLSDSLQLHGSYSPCISPGQNTGVGSLFLLQGIFPTQGSNPDLPSLRSASLPTELSEKHHDQEKPTPMKSKMTRVE